MTLREIRLILWLLLNLFSLVTILYTMKGVIKDMNLRERRTISLLMMLFCATFSLLTFLVVFEIVGD